MSFDGLEVEVQLLFGSHFPAHHFLKDSLDGRLTRFGDANPVRHSCSPFRPDLLCFTPWAKTEIIDLRTLTQP